MSRERAGIGRITAGIVAIAAALPYLTIKILWLSGNYVGVDQPAFLDNPVMVGMNAMTFGMDVVGFVLALSFTTRWGMRLPAWLVLLPIWVGTGLLSVILVVAPLGVLIEGFSIFPADGPLQQWVYVAVYGGFIGQAVGLTVAFTLYAKDRWPAVFTGDHVPAGPTRPFQLVIARGALLLAALIGGIKLYWAFGGDAGLPRQFTAMTSVASNLQTGLKGALVIVGGVALLMMVRGGRRPFWQPLVAAWLGTGSMFGWGLYSLIVVLGAGPLAGPVSTPVPDLVEVFATMTGLVMALCGAFLLAERSAVREVQAVQHPLESEDREGDRRPAHQGHH